MSQLERSDIQGIILRGYEEMLAACFVLAHIEKPDNFREWLKSTPFRSAAQKPLRVRKDSCINVAFTRPGLDTLGVPRATFRNVSREFFEGMLGQEDDRSVRAQKQQDDGINHRQRMLGDIGRSAPARWRWGKEAYTFEEEDRAEGLTRVPGPVPDSPTDDGESAGAEPVHVLLMLYAHDDKALRALYEACAGQANGYDHAFGSHGMIAEQPGESSAEEAGDDFKEHGLRVLRVLSTRLLDGRKEHFGYRDGIGQPIVQGEETGSGVDPGNVICPGEFLFGYRNEYGHYPIAPQLEDFPDFGQNGSFLVFRQLAQDVPGFWGFIADSCRSKNKNGAEPDKSKNAAQSGKSKNGAKPDKKDLVWMASKMVGRWPSGAPLVLAPDEDHGVLEDDNDFGYFDEDPHGHRCPFGSHVRRTNPRDAFPGKEVKSTLHSRRHRIMRRGRAYGEPVEGFILEKGYDIDPTLEWKNYDDPHDTETAQHGIEGIARGLHFICFNANIARQFEFVQSTWVMNPKFSGLSRDPDPVCGEHGVPDQQQPPGSGQTLKARFRGQWQGGTFTLQGEPVCTRMTGLRRYVHVRGGGYFFMPGLRALEYLAGMTS